MTVKDFIRKHNKFIIVIIVIIIALIVYRYFWQKASITNDLNFASLENRFYTFEQEQTRPPEKQSLIPPMPGTRQHAQSPKIQTINRSNNTANDNCLTDEMKKTIADAVVNKLEEMNICCNQNNDSSLQEKQKEVLQNSIESFTL